MMDSKYVAASQFLSYAFFSIGILWLLYANLPRDIWMKNLAVPLAFFLAPKRGLLPVTLIMLGGVMVLIPIADRNYTAKPAEAPKAEVAAPEVCLCLHDVSRESYEQIVEADRLTKLQWNSAGVTDMHLEFLRHKSSLLLLDLSDTQVTDDGLKLLSKFPCLKTLRLARTKITDYGFRKYLMNNETLEELDISGTNVTLATANEWLTMRGGRTLK